MLHLTVLLVILPVCLESIIGFARSPAVTSVPSVVYIISQSSGSINIHRLEVLELNRDPRAYGIPSQLLPLR